MISAELRKVSGTTAISAQKDALVGSSMVFLADTSDMSPGTSFICMIKEYTYRVKVSKKMFDSMLKKASLVGSALQCFLFSRIIG